MTESDWSELREGEPEAQHKAALALYESGDPEALGRDAEAMAALRAGVAGDNKSAAALLLLAYDPSPETPALLQAVRREFGDKKAKLQPWSPAVPLALVVTVALSRLGESEARVALLEEIERGALETMAFLLGVLREVDDPTVLHMIARALDDERPVAGGVPSGAAPARRLADMAVDAFVARLGLAVGFARDPARRYAEAEIAEVKHLIRTSLPH